MTKKILESYTHEIFDCFEDIEGNFLFRVPNAYPLQNNKVVISIKFGKTNNLISVKKDGKIYAIKNNNLTILSAKEIQDLVEQKQTKSIKSKMEEKITNVQKECNLMKNFFYSLPILKKFEDNSINLIHITKPIPAKKLKLNEADIVKLNKLFNKNENGKYRGCISYLKDSHSPRLDDTYLRYCLPLFYLRLGSKLKAKETIYLVDGGAVYFARKEYPVYSENSFALKIFSEKPAQYSNKFIVSFLKSSFWLWYSKNKFGSLNLTTYQIFKNIKIPKLNRKIKKIDDIVKSIEEDMNKILGLEKKILSTKIKKNKLKEVIEVHNKKIDELAYGIDFKIYELLNLSEKEINTIETYLRAHNIYLPIFSKNKPENLIERNNLRKN